MVSQSLSGKKHPGRFSETSVISQKPGRSEEIVYIGLPMKTLRWFALSGISLILVSPFSEAADWPQWRGPLRNGIVPDASGLPAELTETSSPVKLWESEEIPSDFYGGHGSVALVDGKVYLSVVWHRDDPCDTRRIDGDVLSTLGHRGHDFSPELVAKMEADRLALSPRLRGKALDDWADQWVADNLTDKQAVRLGSWVTGRFKQGKAALPVSVFEALKSAPKEFPDQAAMEAWVKSQNFDAEITDRIIKAVPNSQKVANDVILCLDAGSGKSLWRFETPGEPSGRASSSTPAVAGGKVFAALSGHIYAISAATGALVWKTPLTGRKGPASSPLVEGELVYLQQGSLTAYDRNSGAVKWENKDASGANASPALWRGPKAPVILCNATNQLVGIDALSGATLWTRPGGGDSSPTVVGDTLALASTQEGQNLSVWNLTSDGPTLVWKKEFLSMRYASSPIIHEDHLYHLGSDRHLCLRISDGETAWDYKASSNISSPLLADGKLFVYENNGGFLAMIKADASAYTPLGRSKVGALRCASPSLVGRRLYLRTGSSVACFEFPEG